MSISREQLKTMVQALLAKEVPNREKIRQTIAGLAVVVPNFSNIDAEALALEFEEIHGYTMEIGAALSASAFLPWLADARTRIDPYYWDRYRKLLTEQMFPGDVLRSLDEVTDRIVGFAENPRKDGPWDRRGMVVGHVQSGKTANYTGVVCKAADAGYRVIIVIAGIHNNLRKQTQERLDQGLVGFDSSSLHTPAKKDDRIVGVGRFDSRRIPIPFTNTNGDFNKATASSVSVPFDNLKDEPAVFVIKKNSSTLKNLIEWLKAPNIRRGATTIDYPMLLIDDEADNASINIKYGKDEVSKINGQIRQLLNLFSRSTYVGYTATPFANIFIEPDVGETEFGKDLFPEDFIVSLDPPTNYFGPDRVFDEDGGVIRLIEDNEDVFPVIHKKDFTVGGFPWSLDEALRTFILVRAIRLRRGQAGKHNSMLVNVSRFTNVQMQVRDAIGDWLRVLRQDIRVAGARLSDNMTPSILELRETCERQFAGVRDASWLELAPHLLEAVGPIEAVAVNSSRDSDPLDYSSHAANGLNVIAVGGFSLSRGLTLEGLSVSYFLRNSIMYDTLMQMGRWFGYRPGYDDLCRVWMREEAVGWYQHVAESTEELRAQFKRMASRGATPRQFGLKVRSHPTTLIVTARNKQGSGQKTVLTIGLSNEFIETSLLSRKPENLAGNREAVAALVSMLAEAGKAPKDGEPVSGGRLVRGAPVGAVIQFLQAFSNDPSSMLTETEPVVKYIRDRSADELATWDILFAGVGTRPDHEPLVTTLPGFELVCQRRAEGKAGIGSDSIFITEKRSVASRGVERVGIDPAKAEAAEKEWLANPSNKGKRNVPDHVFREVRAFPLLIIHPLALGNKGEAPSNREPIIAWSISFPTSGRPEETVSYVVSSTWLAGFFGRDAEPDEEDDNG